MSFRTGAPGVDAEKLLAEVRAAVEEKRGRLFTDAEIEEIATRPLPPVLEGRDLGAALLAELRDRPDRWNYAFAPDAIYRSSRGGAGRLLERLRGLLRPVQKLFWNPVPMIAALSRQSDMNRTTVHLLHNLVLELSRQNLEIQELRNRVLQLQGRLDLLARRERTLETMAVLREEPGPAPAGDGPGTPAGEDRG